MKNRRSLTPEQGVPSDQDALHAMRRGGARREVSERVVLVRTADGTAFDGWALNASKGGVRVILEDKVELGSEFTVVIGDPDAGGSSNRGRIVWIQEEPDGVIAGVEFVDVAE